MATTYHTAIAAGWIRPIAAGFAAGRYLANVAQTVRTIRPGAAGLIFGVAWIAGFVGSVSALLVAAALLVGLYLATVRPAATAAPPAPPAPACTTPPTPPTPATPADAAPAQPTAATPAPACTTPPTPPTPATPATAAVGGLEAALAASGLTIRKLEFGQPTANGRAKKNPTP